MLSNSWKSALQMTLEDPQKMFLRSTKNMKLSGFFSEFWGLNYISFQLFRPHFDNQFFISFNLHFVTRLPVVYKHEKIRHKLFVCVLLIENICWNCFQVDRIQYCEKYINRSESQEGDYFSSYLRLSSQACGGDGRRRKSPLDGAGCL